jgi:hypothetical protein
MIAFFDYLFYRVCEFYKKAEGEGYKLSAVAVVVAMQGFNVGTLFYLSQIIIREKFNVTTLHALAYVTFIFVLNLIKYSKPKYNIEILQERWNNEDKNIRNKKSAMIVTYISMSTIIFFGLVVYLGGKKW